MEFEQDVGLSGARKPLEEFNLNKTVEAITSNDIKDDPDNIQLAKKRKRQQEQAEKLERKRQKRIETENRRSVERQDLQKEQRKNFIKKFVEITTKYSTFLQSKLNNNNSGAGLGAKGGVDVMKQLKYFHGELRSYQVEGLAWLVVLYENSINGILGDEMGLGKTIQIIALFCHLYERKVPGPYLVVAPLSTLGNWQDELKRFAPDLPVVRFQGSLEERENQKLEVCKKYVLDGRKVSPIVITSYQVPMYEPKFFRKFNWQYIVVDEGHRIKNYNTRLSEELRNLSSFNRTLLTGTPLQNNITELWTLFNFLMPELFSDIDSFSTILELEDMQDTNKLLENEAETKIISTIHKVLAPFLLRREKKFVLASLAPKKEMIIYCPMSPLQEALYRAILRQDYKFLTMSQDDPNDIPKPSEAHNVDLRRSTRIPSKVSKSSTSLTIRSLKGLNVKIPHMPKRKYYCKVKMCHLGAMLRQVVNHPYSIWTPLDSGAQNHSLHVSKEIIVNSGKLMVLEEMLPRLKRDGHRILLFCTFVIVLNIVEEYLELKGYKYTRLVGETDYEERNANIKYFQEDEDVFVFLLSTRAGGLGLNLTAADTVIFFDRDWNPMADLQAQDRCHRIGQTKPVMVYSLVCKNTIDEKIVDRGDMKRRLEKVVLQEGKFMSATKELSGNNFLNEEDLKELEVQLNNADKSTKIYPNGMFYSDEQFDEILDRSDMKKEE